MIGTGEDWQHFAGGFATDFKKTRNHDAMLGLCFAWYNWCRKHSTLKTTPAVKAGMASEVWTRETLLAVAAA